MIHAGLAGRCRRRSRWTTFADPEARALNLLARNFGPENLTLDTTWAGDITYVRTREGWVYLATVIDLASRRVVGWAMADHMEASLVCDAMDMAPRQAGLYLVCCFIRTGGSQGGFNRSSQHLGRLSGPARRASRRPVPVEARPVLGQRRIRKLVRHLQTRAHRGPLMAEHRQAALGHLRLDRGLVTTCGAAIRPSAGSAPPTTRETVNTSGLKRHNQPVRRTGSIPSFAYCRRYRAAAPNALRRD